MLAHVSGKLAVRHNMYYAVYLFKIRLIYFKCEECHIVVSVKIPYIN